MAIDPETLEALVAKVTRELNGMLNSDEQTEPVETLEQGVFENMEDAIEAADFAFRKYSKASLADRKRITDSISSYLAGYVNELAQMALDETGMGNFGDKVLKNKVALERTPSVEILQSTAFTGDHGIALVELSAYGVIGALTPSTNPSETIINNSISMLAAGNAVVFSPHPGAFHTSNRAVALINEAIILAGGPKNLVVSVTNPSKEKSATMIAHKKIAMLCATGGPAVVTAVLSSGKKAIGAGEGNPPALVDETAVVEKAAKDIIDGCSFDNNLPCTAEKSVVAVTSICDRLIAGMKRGGAYHVTDKNLINKLTELAMPDGKTPNKKLVGKSAAHILSLLDITADPTVRVIICETEAGHPFVMHEQMIPILPIVRVPDAKAGIDLCCKIEGGRRHSAVCHSKNVDVLSEMGKRIQTTIFVKNGPSFAGVGIGGEGYTTFTIAGPTGEGLVTAANFARKRRCTMVDGFNIR